MKKLILLLLLFSLPFFIFAQIQMSQVNGLIPKLNSKQDSIMRGAGFLKRSGLVWSYDNNTYITSEVDPTIYSWAKQSSKPVYNFSEILNIPTTLSGYGITDAQSKLTDGGILTASLETEFPNPTALNRSDLIAGTYTVKCVDNYPFTASLIVSDPILDLDGYTVILQTLIIDRILWSRRVKIKASGNIYSNFTTNTSIDYATTAGADDEGNRFQDTYAKLPLSYNDLADKPTIPSQTIVGRNSSGVGSTEALDAATVKAILQMSDFNINRPITLTGTNNTGKNLGASGQTIFQFLESFFFPSVPATPPTISLATTTIPVTVPYSTWKTWSGVGNPPSKNVDFNWTVVNNSYSDNTDDKAITSIKLKNGTTVLSTATPTGGNQSGTFTAIQFSNVYAPTVDFSKVYTLEVVDAQPNTVTSNVTLTMKAAIQLTYGTPTVPITLYEYKNTDENVSVSWSITANDESISSIFINGADAGSISTTGTKVVALQSVTTGGAISRTYPLVVTGSIYGQGVTKYTPTVSWANRLFRGVVTSDLYPNDPNFTFTDNQIKSLLTAETKLSGNWKDSNGYSFTCGAGGQFVCFAYPDDGTTPTVQYYDSNFSSWMTYDPSKDVTIINRANFVNQYGYSGTNYKIVFVNPKYAGQTVKVRIQ